MNKNYEKKPTQVKKICVQQSAGIQDGKRTKKASKYESVLYEGRWTLDRVEKDKYILKNIYNQREISLFGSQMKRVAAGKTSIGNVIRYQMTGVYTKSQIYRMKVKMSYNQQ